jgi:DNA-binding transcriptional LysR family regulator
MSPSKLDLHSLIVFYCVASEESVTAAADKLCLTQPTVTYHIRSLERNVGLKLLDIKRQKVFLTPAGAGLFRYVSEIHRQMTSAERFLENIKDDSLRVGVCTTFSTSVALAAATFEKLYPHVRLIIRSRSSFEVADDVLGSNVDLGVVVSMDYGSPKLRAVSLSPEEKLVLVASASSAIFRKQRLEFLNLCGYPLVLGPETSATRRIIQGKLRTGGCGVPSPVIVEVDSSDWGISLVENGEGVGLHHIRSVEKAIAEGRLRVLSLSRDITVGVDALLRADAPEHPMAEDFISLVRETFANGNGDKAAPRLAAERD